MGHRQDMTPEQRLKWDTENYRRKLEANKGSNYEYWNDKHEDLLKNGWELKKMQYTNRRTNTTYEEYSTTSEQMAKEEVENLRSNNYHARIVCGYDKNRQRIKMYSVIFKSKKK
jgi:hypothetical protein